MKYFAKNIKGGAKHIRFANPPKTLNKKGDTCEFEVKQKLSQDQIDQFLHAGVFLEKLEEPKQVVNQKQSYKQNSGSQKS